MTAVTVAVIQCFQAVRCADSPVKAAAVGSTPGRDRAKNFLSYFLYRYSESTFLQARLSVPVSSLFAQQAQRSLHTLMTPWRSTIKRKIMAGGMKTHRLRIILIHSNRIIKKMSVATALIEERRSIISQKLFSNWCINVPEKGKALSVPFFFFFFFFFGGIFPDSVNPVGTFWPWEI